MKKFNVGEAIVVDKNLAGEYNKLKQLIGKTLIVNNFACGPVYYMKDSQDEIMVKGIGVFNQNLFNLAEDEDIKDDTYYLILQTKEILDKGGEHYYQEDVVFHEFTDLGIHIELQDGKKWFYSWSFRGGIEAVLQKDEYMG